MMKACALMVFAGLASAQQPPPDPCAGQRQACADVQACADILGDGTQPPDQTQCDANPQCSALMQCATPDPCAGERQACADVQACADIVGDGTQPLDQTQCDTNPQCNALTQCTGNQAPPGEGGPCEGEVRACLDSVACAPFVNPAPGMVLDPTTCDEIPECREWQNCQRDASGSSCGDDQCCVCHAACACDQSSGEATCQDCHVACDQGSCMAPPAGDSAALPPPENPCGAQLSACQASEVCQSLALSGGELDELRCAENPECATFTSCVASMQAGDETQEPNPAGVCVDEYQACADVPACATIVGDGSSGPDPEQCSQSTECSTYEACTRAARTDGSGPGPIPTDSTPNSPPADGSLGDVGASGLPALIVSADLGTSCSVVPNACTVNAAVCTDCDTTPNACPPNPDGSAATGCMLNNAFLASAMADATGMAYLSGKCDFFIDELTCNAPTQSIDSGGQATEEPSKCAWFEGSCSPTAAALTEAAQLFVATSTTTAGNTCDPNTDSNCGCSEDDMVTQMVAAASGQDPSSTLPADSVCMGCMVGMASHVDEDQCLPAGFRNSERDTPSSIRMADAVCPAATDEATCLNLGRDSGSSGGPGGGSGPPAVQPESQDQIGSGDSGDGTSHIEQTCPQQHAACTASSECDAILGDGSSQPDEQICMANSLCTALWDCFTTNGGQGDSTVAMCEWQQNVCGVNPAVLQLVLGDPAPPAPAPVEIHIEIVTYTPEQAVSAAEDMARELAALASTQTAATEDTAAPPPPPVVEIAAVVGFPVDISTIAEGTDERSAFESEFKTSMANSIGGGSAVSEDDIIVDAITGTRRRVLLDSTSATRRMQTGAVDVEFHIVAPATVSTQAASLVAAVDESSLSVAGTTASTISDPVVTAPPDVDCVGAWDVCDASCSDIVYRVTAVVSGSGTACEADHYDTTTCAPGDGDCPATVQDTDSTTGTAGTTGTTSDTTGTATSTNANSPTQTGSPAATPPAPETSSGSIAAVTGSVLATACAMLY